MTFKKQVLVFQSAGVKVVDMVTDLQEAPIETAMTVMVSLSSKGNGKYIAVGTRPLDLILKSGNTVSLRSEHITCFCSCP